MASFRLLHSLLQDLSYNELKITGGFERAFATLFDQDVQTFIGSMLLNLDQLEKQLDKEEFQETGSMDAFRMQSKQGKVDSSKALDASLVVIECSGTKLVSNEEPRAEYFKPPPNVDHPVLEVPTPVPAASTSSPSSTTVDQDAPSKNNDPYFGIPIPEPSSEETTLQGVIPSNLYHLNQSFDTLTKMTKNHPLENVIGDPSRSVFDKKSTTRTCHLVLL
ncbi:hypothetical protein Tco_0418482 [Tanacetum coccineum]